MYAGEINKPPLNVALRGRAWIEMVGGFVYVFYFSVALRGRAWIEIVSLSLALLAASVALRGRAWIEIPDTAKAPCMPWRRPPREGVD